MQALKLLFEIGPLVVFFGTNYWFGNIFLATGSFMVATAIALTGSWLVFKKVAAMPVITGVFVMVFGGLTLYLENDTFIKVKPTIVNFLFAAILLAGLALNKLWLKIVFADAFQLDDEGWYKLTLRWGAFFIFLGLLNEFVWRTFSTDIWVSFKVFGIMPLTLIFAACQIGLLQRHQLETSTDSDVEAS